MPVMSERVLADRARAAELVQAFVTDCLVPNPMSETAAAELYLDFCCYCCRRRVPPLSATMFGTLVVFHVDRRKTNTGNRYIGFKVKTHVEQ